jgi:DNA repair protein RecO (recombination protein O)
MIWQDEGFLLSKRKFRENGNIIDVFTNTYGKVSGIVYGGNSRKIRNYLQISNKILIFYNSKSENKIGYFKTELIEPVCPKYFSDKKRTSALLSLSSILNLLMQEYQPNKLVYNSLINLIKNFNEPNWYILYVYWELNLIKELGFNPNLSQFSTNEFTDDTFNISIDGSQYNVPSYLLKNDLPQIISNEIIRKSLVFTRSIMQNKFFDPNNLMCPKSRIVLENYFN